MFVRAHCWHTQYLQLGNLSASNLQLLLDSGLFRPFHRPTEQLEQSKLSEQKLCGWINSSTCCFGLRKCAGPSKRARRKRRARRRRTLLCWLCCAKEINSKMSRGCKRKESEKKDRFPLLLLLLLLLPCSSSSELSCLFAKFVHGKQHAIMLLLWMFFTECPLFVSFSSPPFLLPPHIIPLIAAAAACASYCKRWRSWLGGVEKITT